MHIIRRGQEGAYRNESFRNWMNNRSAKVDCDSLLCNSFICNDAIQIHNAAFTESLNQSIIFWLRRRHTAEGGDNRLHMIGTLHANNERNKITEVLLRSAVKTEHFVGVCQVRLMRCWPDDFPHCARWIAAAKKCKKNVLVYNFWIVTYAEKSVFEAGFCSLAGAKVTREKCASLPLEKGRKKGSAGYKKTHRVSPVGFLLAHGYRIAAECITPGKPASHEYDSTFRSFCQGHSEALGPQNGSERLSSMRSCAISSMSKFSRMSFAK